MLLLVSRGRPLLRQPDTDRLTEGEDIPLVVVPRSMRRLYSLFGGRHHCKSACGR